MASLKDDSGTLETRLYIVFDREDEAAHRCPQHLETIFNMLRQVPYEPPSINGSHKVIAESLETYFIEICRKIHNHSFDIFAYRVTKRKDMLPKIRGYIEQNRTRFLPEQHSTLIHFLRHLDIIIELVAKAQATKLLPHVKIKMLLSIYSFWTKHDLLPKDALASNTPTLLDNVDTWLAEKYDIGFQLRRWALKIMSFLISANRLFILTQSNRLRKLVLGKFSVQVLTSPTTAPYSCNLSSEAVQVALDAALAGTNYLPAHSNRESFIVQLQGQEAPVVVRCKPTVHAELAMVMAMVVKGEITHVLPYIGVSKLSCIMCSRYIRAFNEVMGQKIAIRGSHGKASYPGWSWPIPPAHDEELRQAFLKGIRQQLRSDFMDHAQHSSVGSGGHGPEWEIDPTPDDIEELNNSKWNPQS